MPNRDFFTSCGAYVKLRYIARFYTHSIGNQLSLPLLFCFLSLLDNNIKNGQKNKINHHDEVSLYINLRSNCYLFA